MARKTRTPPSKTLDFRAAPRRRSLIEWNDPSRQVHILDWRQRAHGFGLEVDERGDTAEGQPFVQPERLLRIEEPEAFAEQRIPTREDELDEEDDEEDAGSGSDQRVDAAGPREEIDLVRVYLQHLGRRQLLKAPQEVAIGERIEQAQRDLVAALAGIPGAVQTLVALADRIRAKGDPPAELILLPEGGELRAEIVSPVLMAFGRIKRAAASSTTCASSWSTLGWA